MVNKQLDNGLWGYDYYHSSFPLFNLTQFLLLKLQQIVTHIHLLQRIPHIDIRAKLIPSCDMVL